MILPRLDRQSDDPVWQAVAVSPGEFPWPLWYNLLASANTTEVRKLNNLKALSYLFNLCLFFFENSYIS
jgi:hypothetical protein